MSSMRGRTEDPAGTQDCSSTQMSFSNYSTETSFTLASPRAAADQITTHAAVLRERSTLSLSLCHHPPRVQHPGAGSGGESGTGAALTWTWTTCTPPAARERTAVRALLPRWGRCQLPDHRDLFFFREDLSLKGRGGGGGRPHQKKTEKKKQPRPHPALNCCS